MGLLGDSGDGQKPLARKYFAQLKKQGVALEDRRSSIESIRLSSSGEWIIVEAEDCSGLINAESKAGSTFWAFCETLHGKELSGLAIYEAKGKLGFDIEPDHSRIGYWSHEASEDKIEFGSKKATGTSGLTGLTLESMTPKSVNGSGKNGHVLASEAPSTVSEGGKLTSEETQLRARSKAH